MNVCEHVLIVTHSSPLSSQQLDHTVGHFKQCLCIGLNSMDMNKMVKVFKISDPASKHLVCFNLFLNFTKVLVQECIRAIAGPCESKTCSVQPAFIKPHKALTDKVYKRFLMRLL
jgi:hypothetical protein